MIFEKKNKFNESYERDQDKINNSGLYEKFYKFVKNSKKSKIYEK